MAGDPSEPADLPPQPAGEPPTRLPADDATRNVPPRDEPELPRLPADDATRNVPPRDEPELPRLPADDATRNVPPREVWPAELPPDRLPGDHLPTRNVPPPPTPIVDGLPPEEIREFVLPEVEPMGQATTAVLVGRVLMAIAALLVGVAARRSTGGAARADVFWPVAASAAVLTAVGLAGLVLWSVAVAANARTLRARAASGRAMGWSWAIPVGWVVVSSLTYLRVEVDAEVDPLPGIAAVGWVVALAIPYGRLQGVFRSLSRTPPVLWLTAFPLDVMAFGLIWWRLTSWPSPVSGQIDHVETTADVAFGAAAALAVNVLVYVWLAQRASNGMYERLGRLEALHRPDAGDEPEWFRAGMASRPQPAPPVVSRPLIATGRLGTVVSALHVLWGVLLIVSGLVVGVLALRYSDEPVFVGDDLVVDDADVDLVVGVGALVVVSYVAAVVAHGVWAALTAINARRVTVHAPNPGTFVVAFAPAPLLLVAGLVIGDTVGYALVAVGLTVGFVAMILVNQMLVALSGRVGPRLLGFSRWTVCLVVVWVAGVVINLLFSQATSQLGVYAFLSLVQGALVVLGGVIGASAIRALGDEVREHRRVRRAE